MKKLIKTFAVSAIALSFCLVFAGCNMIDEMRANQAKINEDKNAVVFQGKTFYKLPDGIPYYFNDTHSNIINVTDYDVPVLLSEDFCYTGYYDPLNDIIAVPNLSEYFENGSTVVTGSIFVESYEVYNPAVCTFYTQKENYEEYAKLKAEDADRIGFYDDNSDYSTTLFSSSASDEIMNLTKDSKGWSDEEIQNVTGNIYPLYKCNKELSLRGTFDPYEIYITEDDSVYLSNFNTGENIKLSEKSAEEIIDRFLFYY